MRPCKVDAATALFSPAEQEQLVAALADSDQITNSAVVTWIDKRRPGLPLSARNVADHRKGRCSCAQTTR